jgi:uncharacterized membrane protein
LELLRMKTLKIHYQTILIALALLVIPIGLVAALYPILPTIQVPRIGVSGRYFKTVDKHVYYLLALIPIYFYYQLKK